MTARPVIPPGGPGPAAAGAPRGGPSRICYNFPMLADDKRVARIGGDLDVLGKFVEVYCARHHRDAAREPFTVGGIDISGTTLGGRRVCTECRTLLRHAVVKRARCPLEPKPACRVCPVHCYAPKMREGIRRVMAFSGRHLILRGHLHLLLHFLKRPPREVSYREGCEPRGEQA